MEVTTGLTWLQEKLLQNYFGGKKFSLLYKASVHGFSGVELFRKCCQEAPTMSVIYSRDYVMGVYAQKSYDEIDKCSIILFVLQDTNISKCEMSLQTAWKSGIIWSCQGKLSINLETKDVKMASNIIETLGLPKNDPISIQEYEVFRCEDLLDKRKIQGITMDRESLLSTMRTYKPYGDLVPQVRILLLGPIGAGKSSFFNSVKSVFRGHVTCQALVGSDTSGISKKYRTYSIKDERDGNFLPFILCDTLGLGEKEEGLYTEDVVCILKGHISDRYQFDSMKPITSGHQNYIGYPLVKDRIHCVAFVFDANSVERLSPEIVVKIKSIRREVIKCGIVHVALLTHVDSMNLITKGDLIETDRCVPIKLKREAVQRKFGFALSDILVVSNYTSEWELDPVKDVLILSALRQMVWAADDFLEDLPPKERGSDVQRRK
ncbi:interferon-induced protein 44 [Microcebus murinus]|uniref:Interferon-induced protein 44 n=1 Tax=Microcebus murinus TaxID=30608 RepID=A0A8B7HZP0_MICMU|nr:interferon-induced protein 44 [Microcebus murinus]